MKVLFEAWKEVGWPALRKQRLSWFVLNVGVVALILCVRAQQWGLVYCILIITALYLMLILSGAMLERTMSDLRLMMEATEPIMASLVYEKQRADAIADLIRLYESQGKYGIPTDVLLTEMNKVEKKDGHITSISVVPIPPPQD